MSGDGVVHADFPVLEDVRARFESVATAFATAGVSFGLAHHSTVSGAGQLSSELASGAAAFRLSWREVTSTCEDSARLVAGNVGRTAVDLAAADATADAAIDLSAPSSGGQVPR